MASADASASLRVVVVGGGFGGLYAARELGRAPVELTLVDRRNHHLFQPLLYQVATGGLSPADIASPLRHVLARQRNTRVLMAEMVDLDAEGRRVILADGELPYDLLVIATGSQPAYFGHEAEWAPHAPGLKELEDATRIRARVLGAFERAEREPDAERQRALSTFVIVGGGPTGVELAGAVAELARDTLRRDFRRIDPTAARILLIEAAARILGAFPPGLSRSAQSALERLGVEVLCDTRVTRIEAARVHVQRGEREFAIESAGILWAAGVRPSALGRTLAERARAELDAQGRVIVSASLTLPTRPEIFVLGDLARCESAAGEPLPALAPVAMQQGRYVGRAIARRARGVTPVLSGNQDRPFRYRDRPFRYRDRGLLATIGRSAAVAQLGRFQLHGFPAWLLWLFVHLLYLVGFANRLLVAIQWAWSYLTRKRTARLITDQPPVDDSASPSPPPAPPCGAAPTPAQQ